MAIYAHTFMHGEEIDEAKRCELIRFLVESSDGYKVSFPEEKYKDEDAFYNGYDLLKDSDVKKIGEDNDGFSTWETWEGVFNEDKKVKLIVYLSKYPIYNIIFTKDGEDLYQINDFKNLYSYTKLAYKRLREKFPDLNYFVFEEKN